MESARKEVWRNSESENLLRSFPDLTASYSTRMARFLRFNSLVGYPAHLVWLDLTKRRRRYMIDHGQTLLRLLPVAATKL